MNRIFHSILHISVYQTTCQLTEVGSSIRLHRIITFLFRIFDGTRNVYGKFIFHCSKLVNVLLTDMINERVGNRNSNCIYEETKTQRVFLNN